MNKSLRAEERQWPNCWMKAASGHGRGQSAIVARIIAFVRNNLSTEIKARAHQDSEHQHIAQRIVKI